MSVAGFSIPNIISNCARLLPDRRHRHRLAGLGEVEDEHPVVVAFAIGARPADEARLAGRDLEGTLRQRRYAPFGNFLP